MEDEYSANDLGLGKTGVKNIAHEVVDRVSDDAIMRVMYQEENRIKERFRLANIVASRAGRQTIREDDLRVVEQILESEL
jgi:histone H3/H4